MRQGSGVVINWTPKKAVVSLSTGQGLYSTFSAQRRTADGKSWQPWPWPAGSTLVGKFMRRDGKRGSEDYPLTIAGNVAVLDSAPSKFLDELEVEDYKFRIYYTYQGRPWLWITADVVRDD